MDTEKFTERARGFIQSAQGLALRSQHQAFKPEHLLKVLLDDEEGLSARLIRAAGGRPEEASRETELALARLPRVEGGQMYLAPETARLFDSAQEIAKKAGDSFVTVEILLVALAMAQGTDAARILRDAGVKPQNLNAAIKELRQERTADSASAESGYICPRPYGTCPHGQARSRHRP
jgi:ATP-dependent Clp protease ATP-binding subunit ClpB